MTSYTCNPAPNRATKVLAVSVSVSVQAVTNYTRGFERLGIHITLLTPNTSTRKISTTMTAPDYGVVVVSACKD